MKNTSKPKHTIANNGSMKALQRFIQTEMIEHDECLTDRACIKVKITKLV